MDRRGRNGRVPGRHRSLIYSTHHVASRAQEVVDTGSGGQVPDRIASLVEAGAGAGADSVPIPAVAHRASENVHTLAAAGPEFMVTTHCCDSFSGREVETEISGNVWLASLMNARSGPCARPADFEPPGAAAWVAPEFVESVWFKRSRHRGGSTAD